MIRRDRMIRKESGGEGGAVVPEQDIRQPKMVISQFHFFLGIMLDKLLHHQFLLALLILLLLQQPNKNKQSKTLKKLERKRKTEKLSTFFPWEFNVKPLFLTDL